VAFGDLSAVGYDAGVLHGALREALEREREAGRISESVFRGFAGDARGGKGRDRPVQEGPGGQPERQRPASEAAREEVAGARPPPPIGRPGRRATVELASGRSLPITYAVVSADELVPSHDARAGFKKNPGGDLNERPYDDPVEGRPMRETVEGIARAPKMGLLTTDTPSPIDGPPIVSARGVVLGGNARTMGMQLAYSKGGKAAKTVRQGVHEAAARFGVEGVAGIKDPVLVRVVDAGEEGERGELSRILNEGLTTAKGATTEAVSRGSKLTPEVARGVARIVGDGTLREALGEPAKAQSIARELVQAGAMTQGDVFSLFDPNRGVPTAAGKQAIEDALLGSIVPDVRVLSELSPSARNALLRALPSLVTLKGAVEGFPEIMLHVAQGAVEVTQTGQPLGDVLEQQVLPGIDVGWKSDETAVGILRAMLNR